MSTTINETITTVLRNRGYGSYVSYIGPVEEALATREREIGDRLIEAAADQDIDTDVVREVLEKVGLNFTRPEPELEPEPEDTDTTDDRMSQILTALDRINSRLDALEETARRYGARV